MDQVNLFGEFLQSELFMETLNLFAHEIIVLLNKPFLLNNLILKLAAVEPRHLLIVEENWESIKFRVDIEPWLEEESFLMLFIHVSDSHRDNNRMIQFVIAPDHIELLHLFSDL